jgi:enhancing lycopene biosynthesis protein 2
LSSDDFSAVIFPGGFGAAKNLSTFGVSGDPEVDDQVARVLREFREKVRKRGI